MRIRTKTAVGYVILIVLLLLVQLYQVGLLRNMLETNRYLSQVNFRVGRAAADLQRSLDELREFAQKYSVSGDPRYKDRVLEMGRQIEDSVANLGEIGESEREEIKGLQDSWNNFAEVFEEFRVLEPEPVSDEEQDPLLPPATSDRSEVVEKMEKRLEDATSYAERISLANEQAIHESVIRLQEMGEDAGQVSIGVVVIGLCLSLLLSVLVVRSISKPLSQLTRGTREIAAGDFSVVVDESSRDELGELGVHFNAMVRRLSELDQLKKDFVSHISHELKAPLASMQETTKLLLEGIPGQLNEQQRRLLRLNLGSGDRLSNMIRNVLDLSSIEAGAMHYRFETRDIVPTVRRAVDEYHGLYLEKQLKVELVVPAEPILVKLDEERCVQLVGNLLANAITFSPKGDQIRIVTRRVGSPPKRVPEIERTRLGRSPDGLCQISVYDRGPGVPDEDKKRIFERFFMKQNGRKGTGQATGLGLAISRRIAAAHSGILWVEDNPGGGSIFSFLLPAQTGV